MPHAKPLVGSGTGDQAPLPHPARGRSRRSGILIRHVPLLYPLLLFALPDTFRLSIGVAPETLLLLFLVTSGALLDLGQRHGRETVRTLTAVPLVAWGLFSVLLASRLSYAEQVGAGEVARVGLWALTFAFAFQAFGTAAAGRRLARLWSAIAVVAAAIVLSRPALWAAPEWHLLAFQHRTLMGYFLAPAAAWTILAATGARTGAGRLAGYFLGGVLVTGLAVTLSRGPWLVFGATMVALLFQRHSRHRWWAVTALAVLVAGSALLAGGGDLVLRIRSIWDFGVSSSSPYRLDLLLAAIRSVPELGWLGGGPGSAGPLLFQRTEQAYSHIPSTGRTGFATDSDLVWLLLEAGPLAALLILALLATWTMAVCRHQRWTGRESAREVSTALLALAVGLCLLDNTLATSFGWFILGAGLGLAPRRAAHPAGSRSS